MKSSFKFLILSIMLLPSLLFFSACGNDVDSDDLKSISVSGVTTEFNVGDEFSVNNDAKVIITTKGGDVYEYTTDGLEDDDEDDKTFTAEEYTIDYSAYDKNTPGIYDIVIESKADDDILCIVKVTVKATDDNAWVTQPTIDGWDYGTPNAPTGVAKYGVITYEYKVKDAADSTYSATVPTTPGNYTMRAGVGVTTYHGAIAPITVDFEISKLIMSKPTISTDTLTFNGKSQEVDVFGVDLLSMNVTGDLEKINAGTTVITVSLKDKINSAWDDGTTDDVELNFVIEKASVVKVSADTTVFEFNGQEQIYTPVDFDSDFMTITGHKMTNPGEQTVTVKLKNETNANCQWVDGTTGDITFTFEILASKIEKPLANEAEFGWNGNAQTYLPSGFDANTMTITNNVRTDMGAQEVSVAIKNPAHCTWADNTTTEVKFQFEIVKGAIVKPKENSATFVYNGKTQEYNVVTDYPNAIIISNNQRKDTGSQTVTVALKDKEKATWIDGTTDDLSFNFEIYLNLDEKYENLSPEAGDLKIAEADLANLHAVYEYLFAMGDVDKISSVQFDFLNEFEYFEPNFDLYYEFFDIDTTNKLTAQSELATKLGIPAQSAGTLEDMYQYLLENYKVVNLNEFFHGPNTITLRAKFATANNYTAEEAASRESMMEKMGITQSDTEEREIVIQNNTLISIDEMAIPFVFYEPMLEIAKFFGLSSDDLTTMKEAFDGLLAATASLAGSIMNPETATISALDIEKARTAIVDFIRAVGLDVLIVGNSPGMLDTLKMFENFDNISLNEYMYKTGTTDLRYKYTEGTKVVYNALPKSSTDLGTIVYGIDIFNPQTNEYEFVEGKYYYEQYDKPNTLTNESTQDEINELISDKAQYIYGLTRYNENLKTYQFYKENDMNALIAKSLLMVEDMLVGAINSASVDNLTKIANTIMTIVKSFVPSYLQETNDIDLQSQALKPNLNSIDLNAFSNDIFNIIQIINNCVQKIDGADLIYNEIYKEWKPLLLANVVITYDTENFENFARNQEDEENALEYRAYLNKCVAFYDIMEDYLYVDLAQIIGDKLIDFIFEGTLEDTNNSIAVFKDFINLAATVDEDGLLTLIKSILKANSATESVDPTQQGFALIDKVINNVSEDTQATIKYLFNVLISIVNDSVEEYYVVNWEEKLSSAELTQTMKSYDAYFGNMTFEQFQAWISDVADGKKSFGADSLMNNVFSMLNNYLSDEAFICITSGISLK